LVSVVARNRSVTVCPAKAGRPKLLRREADGDGRQLGDLNAVLADVLGPQQQRQGGDDQRGREIRQRNGFRRRCRGR
jgi:hypothetical protein